MISVDNAYIVQYLKSHFEKEILNIEEPYGFLTIEVKKDGLIALLDAIKNDAVLQMNFLTDLCGVHYPESPNRELAVVYHLHSFINNVRLRLKVFIPAADPQIPSATTVFDTANWMERETFDFYGILFQGHPNLKRILNVDDMDYHPLLKQYRLEDGTRTDKVDSFFGR